MNEFKTDHLKQSVFIFLPALPLSRAEPHIAIVLCETLAVKHFKEGELFINSITTAFIYVFLLFLNGKRKGYSILSGMNNLD